jgi:folate-binding protein YgfZ
VNLAASGPPPYLPGMTIAHLADRAVLAITGADALPFLQGLLTNDVTALAPGAPVYAGLLSPQGKALFTMILHAGPDGAVLADVDAAAAPALQKRLALYKLRKAVTLALTDWQVLAGWGADAGAGQADPRDPALGARWLVPADQVPAGASGDYTAHRLALGVAEAEIGSDELLWLETGADLLNGVSFTKGCYVGQENTARMHHRDKVRRRLVPVILAGMPDAAGQIMDAAGRSCGTLRSVAGGQGIAHLRLEAAAGPLTCGSAAVTVQQPAWLAGAW